MLPFHVIEYIDGLCDIDTKICLRKALHIAPRPVIVPDVLRTSIADVFNKLIRSGRSDFKFPWWRAEVLLGTSWHGELYRYRVLVTGYPSRQCVETHVIEVHDDDDGGYSMEEYFIDDSPANTA